MMKSAGEQSQGQAVLQGFSAQNSHLFISLISWASVKTIFMLLGWDQFSECSLSPRKPIPSMKS
jgi:hypothetical protein